MAKLSTILSSEYDSVSLEKFAPWLQRFHWLMGDESIELPGQYTGESRPNIKTNIRIVRFNGKVKVFHTKCRPIKLSILCSNGNTYDFLIKYGEDLRQDQCVQQMQRLITDRMLADKNCRSHSLSIGTFHVIPISSYCGLLSWVHNTQSLSEFVNFEKVAIVQAYRNFLKHAPNGRADSVNTFTMYGEAVASYPLEKVHVSNINKAIPIYFILLLSDC